MRNSAIIVVLAWVLVSCPMWGQPSEKCVSLGNGLELKLVKVSDELWVAEGRVTGEQYAALLTSVQGRLSKEQLAVFRLVYGDKVMAKESFTWDEAWNWCNLLNVASPESVPADCEFRLPTKREWAKCKAKGESFVIRDDMFEWCLDAVLDKQQPIQFPAPRGFVVSKVWGIRETKPVMRVVMMGNGKQFGRVASYFLKFPYNRENPNQVLNFMNGGDRIIFDAATSAPITFRVVLGPVVPLQ